MEKTNLDSNEYNFVQKIPIKKEKWVVNLAQKENEGEEK